MMTRIALFLVTLLPLAAASDVGNEGWTVPPFKCFGTTAVNKYEMTSVPSDLSGITWNPSTKTLFAVNNGDRMIYEIEYPNKLVQKWDVKALTEDLEGISALGGRKFAITDENPVHIIEVTLNADGTYSGATPLVEGITPKAASNLGFEGVTKIGTTYYAVQEASPAKLWKLESGATAYTDLSGDLEKHATYQLKSIGGLTRGGDATDELFLMAKTYTGTGRDGSSKYYQKGIIRYKISDGTILERFGGEMCNMGQPEGLTFWKDDTSGKIRMLMVGETHEARLYEADPSCTDAIGSITNNMATCVEKKVSTATCEKTKADGGCPWTRCDKDITDHNKICTDKTPGVTDCTETQCFNHCNNTLVKGKKCTHWAYDVAEKECYIFAGCKNDKFDEDYTTYAMEDPTCEKTRAKAPLGCEKRRCDKGESKHLKICTDATPGTTDCTLDQCEDKCKKHTDFTCTTYAYDVKEKECYLFETCEGEKFDEDYSTYVLRDPTCEEPRNSTGGGGCTQRRCDKDITPHTKICVDDCPEAQCTIDQCEIYCAQTTFTKEHAEAFCTHWAYDEVDKECYLFYGCKGEQYDDDYTLFTQSYGERTKLQGKHGKTIAKTPTCPAKSGAASNVAGAFTFLAAAALVAV